MHINTHTLMRTLFSHNCRNNIIAGNDCRRSCNGNGALILRRARIYGGVFEWPASTLLIELSVRYRRSESDLNHTEGSMNVALVQYAL